MLSIAHCLSFVSFRTPILCESSNKIKKKPVLYSQVNPSPNLVWPKREGGTRRSAAAAKNLDFSLSRLDIWQVSPWRFSYKTRIQEEMHFCIACAAAAVLSVIPPAIARSRYVWVCIRCLVGSTDQACSSGFYFRIAWKSMKQPCFLQNHSLSFLQGLRSLKNWLLQKLSMKSLDQNF